MAQDEVDLELELPSSPPMYNEPCLPQARLLDPIRDLSSRKRSSHCSILQDEPDLVHTSSDPALFSSDETPDAENYVGPKRRKKHYVGTWWGELALKRGLSSSSSRAGSVSSSSSSRRSLEIARISLGVKKGRGRFKRNFDSGIFMNSDDSQASSDIDISSDSSLGNELIEAQRRLLPSIQLAQQPQSTLHSSEAHRVTPSSVLRTRHSDLGEADALLKHKKLQTVNPTSPSSVKLSQTPRSPYSPRTLRLATYDKPIGDLQRHVTHVVRQCLEDSKENVDLS